MKNCAANLATSIPIISTPLLATPTRSYGERSYPYPERIRTPVRSSPDTILSTPITLSPPTQSHAVGNNHEHADTSHSTEQRYQLILQPIVKNQSLKRIQQVSFLMMLCSQVPHFKISFRKSGML